MLHLKHKAQISQFSMAANIIRCSGLKTDDYYVMQGLGFIILITAGIKAAFKRKQISSGSWCVSQLSVRACLAKAARIKLCQHQDQRWYLPVAAPEVAELMSAMGADLAGDLRRLNAGQIAGEISSVY